jgi:esterase/lipase superfamily enzyme
LAERQHRDMFSGEQADQVSYATVTVSIPPDAGRKIGDIQWPTSLPANPQKDFATIAANYLDKQSFAAVLTAEAKQTKRSKLLVFLHGFNNRFDEAVYRFAQIVTTRKRRVYQSYSPVRREACWHCGHIGTMSKVRKARAMRSGNCLI